MIASCDGRGGACPFFIFNDSQGIVQETAYYARQPYASRFPSFWFLPRLLDPSAKNLTDAERQADFHRYAAMVADDFATYRPRLVLIGRFDVWHRPFDFVRYFGRDAAFAGAFAHYRPAGQMTLDRRIYTKGTELENEAAMPFDIYVRTGDAP